MFEKAEATGKRTVVGLRACRATIPRKNFTIAKTKMLRDSSPGRRYAFLKEGTNARKFTAEATRTAEKGSLVNVHRMIPARAPMKHARSDHVMRFSPRCKESIAIAIFATAATPITHEPAPPPFTAWAKETTTSSNPH